MPTLAYKLRAYSTILSAATHVGALRLFRAVTCRKHPKGWSAEQEMSVAVMAALCCKPWQDVRALTSIFVMPDPPELKVTPVPAAQFETAGWRESYWVELKPDLQPQNPKASLVMMYIHGGGFCFGEPMMYKHVYPYWLKQLAQQGIHMKILAVGYPLSPEHPFPGGLHAVVEAYDWLVKQQGSSDKVILAGDSAGGNLVMTALAYMKERSQGFPNTKASAAVAGSSNSGDPSVFQPPLAAVLISPAPDLTKSAAFWRPKGDEIFKYDYITSWEVSDISQLFAPPGGPAQVEDPLLSPIFLKDFSGLVQRRMLVITGGCETLAVDIHRFVDHMKASSPDVDLVHHVEPNEVHCYLMLQVPSMVEKGGKVLIDFIADVAANR